MVEQETERFSDKEAEQLSSEELSELQQNAQIPYRVEDVLLMSPGVWNGINWEEQEIRDAAERTEFNNEDKNNALFLDHEDENAEDWVGRVENIRMNGEDLVGDLVIVDKETAVKLEFGAKFGISPKITGRTRGDTMKNFRYDNFSIVVDPAVKTTFINSEIISDDDGDGETVSLQDMQIHEPEWDGTVDQEWDKPNLEDFTDEAWDDLSEDEQNTIGDHFIVSQTGFPADNFTDMALPVVEPNGDLNLNALQNAKARAGQVTGLSGEDLDRVEDMIDEMANENFEDADFGGDEEMSVENQADVSDVDFDAVDEMISDFAEIEGNSRESFVSAFLEWADDENVRKAVDAYVGMGGSLEDGVGGLEDWISEHLAKHGDEEMSSNNDCNEDTMGENLMTEEDETPETQENSVENEEQETTQSVDVDVESLAEKVAEHLEDDDGEDAGDADADEEVENSTDEVESGDFEDFHEFAQAKRAENPDLGIKELAQMFEEESKSAEQKIDEVREEMSSKIDELSDKLDEKEEELSEVKEKAENPQRLSKNTGEDVKSAKDKVEELSDDNLHKNVMRSWLEDAGVSL